MELTAQYISELMEEFSKALGLVNVPAELEILRREWAAKEGKIKGLFRHLKDLSPEEKPAIAALLNKLKDDVELGIESREKQFKLAVQQESLAAECVDLSLPSRGPGLGSLHPVTVVERKISAILKPFGFRNVLGPEVEKEYYCFDALNIPKHHPARDMQDTFFTHTGHVLRTHTTSVQARELEKKELPVKVASFGRVYRNETEDSSHQAMFHQFELVWIDKGLNFSHLLGLIQHILRGLYGKRRKIKFVPKYYPYTEPSIGPQLDCTFCHGKGCSACGNSGWVTVAGAGMVHAKVLQEFGYDPAAVSGLAFGLGSSRLASQFSGIATLKALYENDLRRL